ncbi:hypothetical protein H2204_013270 [Knufia peltigerae]|uniref:Major facilitator superfamily (MFS) profile domain-containing protein n=1 Tax=Knufia peltigerae TaxID=1002370 RepID=A0AA38XQS5_9EURO|nr:hypothetical protein H2204_013270 [Knufia peltigerae]
MFGFDQAVLGTLSTQPAFLAAIGSTDTLIIGWVLSFFSVGAVFGSLLAVYVGFTTGRRFLIFMGCVLMVIGAALQAASFSLAQMLVGRFISGLGIGLMTSSVPVLLAEVAKAHRRGQVICLLFVCGVLGIALADWFDYGIIKHSTNPEYTWRFPVAFQAAFCLVTMATIPFLPESPRWLYAHGRDEDGDNVIARIYDVPEDADIVLRTRASLKVEAEIEAANEFQGWRWVVTCVKAIFYDTTEFKIGKRLRLVILISMLQELSGLNIIVAYSARMFQLNLGFDAMKAAMVSGIIQTVWALFVLASTLTIERFGRKITLYVGTIFCTLGMTGFTICISFGSQAAGWAGMIMLIIFYFGFGFGMLPISWLYPAEVLPSHLRHVGEGIGATTSWIFTFLTLFTGPIAIANTGWKIFILYIIFNFLALPFAYFMLVETKSKTLEEIDYAFGSLETMQGYEHRMVDAQERATHGNEKQPSAVDKDIQA